MKYILPILLFSLSPSLFSQELAYSSLIDVGYPSARLQHMLIENDTIVGYGQAFDTVHAQQGVIFMKLDSSGALLDTMMLLDSLGDPLSVDEHWGGIIKTADGGYAATAAAVGRPSAFLIKLDRDFGVEFVREYADTVNISNFDYSVEEVEDGYLLFGSFQKPDAQILGFVRKVDSGGNFVWQRDFGQNAEIARVPDTYVKENGDIIVLALNGFDFLPTLVQSQIKVLDSEGNQIDSWVSELEPEEGAFAQVVYADAEQILVYGIYTVEIATNTKWVQSTITKFNSDLRWFSKSGHFLR